MNSLGHVITENWFTYSGEALAKYRYRYDQSGNVVMSLDILNGIEYNYYYKGERIQRATESAIEFASSLGSDAVTSKKVSAGSIFEALVCAFVAGVATMIFSGNLPAKKISKYNKQLLRHLQKKKWKIIRSGIRTFWNHVKVFISRYWNGSVAVAIFGTSSHTFCKAVVLNSN